MINPETGQPFTRRELRELEKSGVRAAVSPEASPTVPPTPEQPAAEGPTKTVEAAAPSTHSDVPQFWPEAPVLTRRQRRELEQAGKATPDEAPEPVEASSVDGRDEVTRELADLQEPIAPSVVPEEEPLPPVFAPVIDTPPKSPETPSAGLARGPGDPLRVTSSLILPTAPGADLTGPLGTTGEIIVTGNIRLPSQLAVQGTAPYRLDTDADADDEVLDAYVTGEIGALSQPVSARHAVSGRSKDSDILSIKKTRWGTGTVVTLLVLGTLTLAAVGLVILSVTTGVLL